MALRSGNKVQMTEEHEETAVEIEVETEVEETATETEAPAEEQAAGAMITQEPGVPAPSIESLYKKWDPETYGNRFKRVKGENGMLVTDDFAFGDFIDFQVLSHSERWMVTPDVSRGEPNFKEANRHCRASYDGKTIPGRDGEEPQTIAEYSDELKKLYPKGTKVGKYHDIFGLVFGASRNMDRVRPIDVFQVSISPTAVKQFMAFKMTMPLAVLRGFIPATHQNCMRIIADPKSNDNGAYVIMKFDLTPMDVLKQYTPFLL